MFEFSVATLIQASQSSVSLFSHSSHSDPSVMSQTMIYKRLHSREDGVRLATVEFLNGPVFHVNVLFAVCLNYSILMPAIRLIQS